MRKYLRLLLIKFLFPFIRIHWCMGVSIVKSVNTIKGLNDYEKRVRAFNALLVYLKGKKFYYKPFLINLLIEMVIGELKGRGKL